MKVRVFFFLAIVFALCLTASAAHADLQDDVDRALEIIERFQEIPEKAIPQAVLRDAKGLAIITVAKAGFVVSGRGGTGIVIARTEKDAKPLAQKLPRSFKSDSLVRAGH